MKKLVCSALALSMTSAAGLASDSEWSTLDQEVEALTSSLSLQDEGGPQMFGRIRTYYAISGDVIGGIDAQGNPNDYGGFDVIDARFGVKGSRKNYSYRLEFDLAGEFVDGPELLDAYIGFPIGGAVNGRFGQFRSPISRSGLINTGKMEFVDRNAIGNLFDRRTEGILVRGEFEQVGWDVALQDGSDGNGDDLLISARAAIFLMGQGVDLTEGAVGGSDAPSMTLGVAYYNDGAVEDGDGVVVDFYGGTNVYSFGLDIAGIGDGLTTAAGSAVDPLFGLTVEPDTTPVSLMGTYMLSPETWEIGLRFQDYDNSFNESKIDIAVNNYIDGHNLKWTFQFSTSNSDDAIGDVDFIVIQLQAGF